MCSGATARASAGARHQLAARPARTSATYTPAAHTATHGLDAGVSPSAHANASPHAPGSAPARASAPSPPASAISRARPPTPTHPPRRTLARERRPCLALPHGAASRTPCGADPTPTASAAALYPNAADLNAGRHGLTFC